MIVLHGVDRFGKVDGVDGEYLVTRFHHVFLMPLVPIASEWVTARDVTGLQGRACRLSGKSIVAAYARTWGLAIAGFLFAFATEVSIIAIVAASLLASLGLWTFAWYRTRDPRELRRVALQRPVLGIAVDPLRMPRDTVDLLLPRVQERFDALSGGRTPFEIVQRGATSTEQAAYTFVLLRLVAACGQRPAAFAARWESDRMIDWHLLRDEAGDPYRTAPSRPAAAEPPLLTGYLLAPHRWHFVLATLALWASCVAWVPYAMHDMCTCDDDNGAIARAGARKLAYESYPQWVSRPASAGACPTVRQLAEHGGAARDPFGEEYVVRCDDLPAGAVGIAVLSKGEDKREGTGDDITSWDPP